MGLESQGLAHARIVAVGAAGPEAAKAQDVQGVEHVHGGSATGQQLLALWHLVLGLQVHAQRNDQRGGQGLGAESLGVGLRVARPGGLHEHLAQRMARIALHQHEAPGPQLPVVGGAQCSIDDGVDHVCARRRLLQRPA